MRVTEHIPVIPSSENQVNKPANIKNRTETKKNLQHLQLLRGVRTLGISLPLPQVPWWFSRAGYWQTCRRNMDNRCELHGKCNKTLFYIHQICKRIISLKLLYVCIINQSVWIFCLLLDHVHVFTWYSHSTCICAPDHPYAASLFLTALLGGAISSGALPTVKRSHIRIHAWDLRHRQMATYMLFNIRGQLALCPVGGHQTKLTLKTTTSWKFWNKLPLKKILRCLCRMNRGIKA